MKEFNSYGRPIDRVLDDIQSGDTVEFWYHKNVKGSINKKLILVGIWNGINVTFDDKEQTVVSTKEWLKNMSK